jgi:hypothetical protein
LQLLMGLRPFRKWALRFEEDTSSRHEPKPFSPG